MSRLRKRNSYYLKDASGPAWGASYRTLALPVGAQVKFQQTDVTTINVHKGHGFRVNDWFIVNTDTTKFKQVTVVTDTSVQFGVPSINVNDLDYLVNLGPDTATGGTPDWDGSPVKIFNEMDGSGTAITNAEVTADSTGNYSYFSYNQRIWELIRDDSGTGTPVAVIPDVFEDQEVDNLDSVRSFGAIGDGTADDKAAIQAAIDAADAVSNGRVLLTTGTYRIDSNVTVPAGVRLDFESDAQIKIPTAGTKLTINGDVAAGRTQIFDAAVGDVEFTEQATVFPEWWGADTSSNSQNQFDRAIAALKNGGTVLGAGPAATYVFGATYPATIGKDDITLDFQGAVLKSTASEAPRFTFDGDADADGDWSSAVTNCHFKNARIGEPGSANTMIGPVLIWCQDCTVQNVVKNGNTNTAFNLVICRRCVVRDVWNYGANTAGGKIGLLLYIGFDCLIENVHMRDGAFSFGIQIKGGRNNRVVNCSIEGQTGTGVDEGFKDRGDKPWAASVDPGYSYPWTTGSWTSADSRRASHGTIFQNCSVEASPAINAFTTQESIGTTFDNCTWDDVEIGISMVRLDGGSERDFVARNCHGTNTDLSGIVLAGDSSTELLPGVQILGGHIADSDDHGIHASDCSDLLIEGVEVRNNGQAGGSEDRGIYVVGCIRPRVIGCVAIDDQGTSTQGPGIQATSSCVDPTIIGCVGNGNETADIQAWLPGTYANNTPGEAVAQTTSGSWVHNKLRFKLATGDVVWIEVTAVAEDTTAGGGIAIFKRGGLFYLDGSGNVQQQGSTAELGDPAVLPIRPNTNWDMGFQTPTGDELRVRVKGEAGKTIDWVLHANCYRV